MSAEVKDTSDNVNTPAVEMVNIEVNGVPLKAPKGSMIIEATDKAGIEIPRFCYHPKLSIAANCRMCLVDVEKMPKPVPACATPVMEGMKVYTTSKRALDAQHGVMEFLLINHPLDCPICDQGGECELQDQSMGYGRSVSRFVERKRVVKDKDVGPLVQTEMTRCIHCTRCVRFLDEIAGTQEMGGAGRGERQRHRHADDRDVAAPVQRCASAPGYAFSAGIGILGDEAGKIGTFLDDQGVPTTEVGWDTDVSGYDAIIVNRPSNPGEETFLRFLADTDAAGVGVLFLDTWSNVGGNGIYMLSQYTGNPGARSSGIVTQAITVNLPASPRLDDLYGPVRHTVISDVSELPDKLLRIYGALTRS